MFAELNVFVDPRSVEECSQDTFVRLHSHAIDEVDGVV
jgi:hypothetical protein